ncbi:MAG: c-type cytochrome [Solirubrobacteraceae bacterium]
MARRRAAATPLVAFLAVGLSACGGSSTPTSGGGATSGGSAGSSGRQVFASAGCASCHTLAAAHATGEVGPDLDQLKPSFAAVQTQVTHGGGVMPSFAGQLSKAQIDAVARFVAVSSRQAGG